MGINNTTEILSNEEFNAIRKLVYGTIGVNLTEAKKTLTVSRLNKRLKELRINSYAKYIDFLKNNPGEMEHLFNLITTNVTKFFREYHHFEYLEKTFLPQLEKYADAGYHKKNIRVWSAGCSTGEEPYTIAMVLNEYFSQKKSWKIKLLASDINTQTLEKAKAGIYSYKEVGDIPYGLLKKYFKLGIGENQGKFKVKEVLQRYVTFQQINLTGPQPYPINEPLDIIFCRNVFIYFDKQTQNNVLMRFYKHLKPGGILCLGHSESISQPAGQQMWKLVSRTVYEKLV